MKYLVDLVYGIEEEEKCKEDCECKLCKPVKKSVKFFIPITKFPSSFDPNSKD